MINLDGYKFGNYLRYILGLILLIALVIGGWFGLRFYKGRLNQAAQYDLSELTDSYTKAVSSSDIEQIRDLEKAFGIAADKHKNSKLFPYFLAYQADALILQNKFKEAVAVLENSVKLISSTDKTNPLYYLYAEKLAKLKLDIPEFESQGKEELEKLSQIKENPFKNDKQ